MVENVEEYLKNAELFVLPSRSEGLSNALLEAMSHGLPCIASYVGGNGEVLGGGGDEVLCKGEYLIVKNGILVQPDDVESLSKAILYLVRNKNERGEMIKRGRMAILENYSIESVAEKYVALYRQMLDGKS
jgi:glycosyltransferase involved in cell wall biosynthesis